MNWFNKLMPDHMSFDINSLREARRMAADQPLRSLRSVLLEIGGYFENTLPTRIDDRFILEVEAFLHTLYLRAMQESNDREFVNHIRSALALSAELADYVQKRPGTTRDRKFFETVIEFGETIRTIAYRLS